MKSSQHKRIIISGGGTGGHVFPAISIADELRSRLDNPEILFVGAKNRMEMDLRLQHIWRHMSPSRKGKRSLDPKDAHDPKAKAGDVVKASVGAKTKGASKASYYMIASDDDIIVALKEIFSEFPVVESQKKLKEFVDARMESTGAPYKVSESRLRRIAILNGIAKVEIRCRESHGRKAIARCPVCGSKLKMIKNRTVFGGTVTLEHQCVLCPYWTGMKHRVPMKYIFTYKR